MNAFQYNSDAKYSVGGVYKPTHQFSLVNQTIQVNTRGSFTAKFFNIWNKYKLPPVEHESIYNDWLANPMQFWQNQLNFAVWCATTGCGVSKEDHLRHKDPMIRSVYRFHVYYQIRRILKEMECPLPDDLSWNAYNNGININAYHRICSEFDIGEGVSLAPHWRQKLDLSFGMGTMLYHVGQNIPQNPSDPKHHGKWGKGDWMPNEMRLQFTQEKHFIKHLVVRFFSWHGHLVPIPR